MDAETANETWVTPWCVPTVSLLACGPLAQAGVHQSCCWQANRLTQRAWLQLPS